jgi:hypothetical protein
MGRESTSLAKFIRYAPLKLKSIRKKPVNLRIWWLSRELTKCGRQTKVTSKAPCVYIGQENKTNNKQPTSLSHHFGAMYGAKVNLEASVFVAFVISSVMNLQLEVSKRRFGDVNLIHY